MKNILFIVLVALAAGFGVAASLNPVSITRFVESFELVDGRIEVVWYELKQFSFGEESRTRRWRETYRAAGEKIKLSASKELPVLGEEF